MPKNPFQKLIRTVSDHYDADVLVYIGPIERPFDDMFIARCKNFKRRKNVVLLLTTPGGDPHAAYRIARCLQHFYSTVGAGSYGTTTPSVSQGKFYLFVDTRCKSAGTILATGANILMFSDYGELGPIDVQLRKGDEVGERSSGLTPMHALESLQQLAAKTFEDCFKGLRFNSELAFSTKGASEIATKMAVGLFGPVYSQIDPMRIGETDRAMRIAADYGTRLGKGNLKDDALKRLLTTYPAHGFVIDRREATDLFNSVEDPTSDLLALGEIVRNWWVDEYINAEAPLFLYLTTDEVLADDETDNGTQQPSAGDTVHS